MSAHPQTGGPTPSSLPPLPGISIRIGTPADNNSLIALTRATPMAGTIALRIDREPDFFALLRARGDAVFFVATHQDDPDRIIGCMSAAVYPVYIQGKLEKIAHAGDLKVHPEYTGRRLALHLVSAIEHHLRNLGVDLSFNLVADGNHKVMTIALGKHGTPVQVMLGRFFVNEILPSPCRKRNPRYTVADAAHADMPAMVEMLDSFARERNFARPTTLQDLEARLRESVQPGAAFTRILVARAPSGATVATLTVQDTSPLRRNVPIAVPLALRLMLPLLRLLFLPVRGIRIPRLGEPLSMLHVRYMACAPGHEPALRTLISHARAIAFSHRATFLSVGLHERDPLRSAVSGLPGLRFTSRAMATSLITSRRVEDLVDQVPYEDFALV